MNHKTFEDWLFTDLEQPEDTLNREQSQRLHAHLETCESCQQLALSWRAVELDLKAAPMAAPAPGFTSRWEARLMAERKRLERRQSLAILGFSVAGAVLLLGSLLLLAWPWLQSPSVVLWGWLYRLLTLTSVVSTVGDILATMFQSVTGLVSPGWWILIAGLVCELAVLWVVSFRLLTNPRRIML
jgi:hypothetical protein